MCDTAPSLDTLQRAVNEAVDAYEGLLADHFKAMEARRVTEVGLQSQVADLQFKNGVLIDNVAQAHAALQDALTSKRELEDKLSESLRRLEQHKTLSSDLYACKRQCAALRDRLDQQKRASHDQEAVIRSAFKQVDALQQTERRLRCGVVYTAGVRNAFRMVAWGFYQWSDVAAAIIESKEGGGSESPITTDISSSEDAPFEDSSNGTHTPTTGTLHSEDAASTASSDDAGAVVESPLTPAPNKKARQKALRRQRDQALADTASAHFKKTALATHLRRWNANAAGERLCSAFEAWQNVILDKHAANRDRTLAVISGTEKPSELSRLGIYSAFDIWFGDGRVPPALRFSVGDRMFRTEHMQRLDEEKDVVVTADFVVVTEVHGGPFTHGKGTEKQRVCTLGAVRMSNGGLYEVRRAEATRDMLLAVFSHSEPLELLSLWASKFHPKATNLFQRHMTLKTKADGEVLWKDSDVAVGVKWLDGKVQPNLPVVFDCDKICEVDGGTIVWCTHNGQTFPVRVLCGGLPLSEDDLAPADPVPAGGYVVTLKGVTFVQPELVPPESARLQVVSATDEIVEVKVVKGRGMSTHFRFGQVRKADLTSAWIRCEECVDKLDVISWLVLLCSGKPDTKVLAGICEMARENCRLLKSSCQWVPNSDLLGWALRNCCSENPNEDYLKTIWEVVSAMRPDSNDLACIWADFYVRADVHELKRLYNCFSDNENVKDASFILVSVPQWVALFASRFSTETLRSFNLLATSTLPAQSLSIKWTPCQTLRVCMNETVLNIMRITKSKTYATHKLLKHINDEKAAFLWFCESNQGLKVVFDGAKFVATVDDCLHTVPASDWVDSSAPPDDSTLVVRSVTDSMVVFESYGGDEEFHMRNPKTPSRFPLEPELAKASIPEGKEAQIDFLLAGARNQWKVLCEMRTHERVETTPCLLLHM